MPDFRSFTSQRERVSETVVFERMEIDFKSVVGRNIRAAREARGMIQEQLAEAVGYSVLPFYIQMHLKVDFVLMAHMPCMQQSTAIWARVKF